MAELKTVAQALKYLSLVLQDKAITDEFINVYCKMLQDLPDEVLRDATLECIKSCRFFPTIADIREKAQPILQAWSLNNRRALENNEFSKCEGNVEYVGTMPICKLEKVEGGCRFSGTGLCRKWDTQWR